MEDLTRENKLKVLDCITRIEKYFGLKCDVDFYEGNKNLFRSDSESGMTGLDEEYFINVKDLLEHDDPNDFWLSVFKDINPSFYASILCGFKKDNEREMIISGLKAAYESMNKSFKKDYLAVYNFLLNYWTEQNTVANQANRIKWEKQKMDFAIYVKQEFERSGRGDFTKFVTSLYNNYEFPSKWNWTLERCLNCARKA